MTGTSRIVIMAGGTGGHVFPALAVAEELRQRGWDVSWLGTSQGLESRIVPAHQFAIDWLSVSGLRGKGFVFKLVALYNLLKACLQARLILKKRKPNIVLGMGGFVAGPGGLMAKWLGIPLVIHEQNRVPGTTNRWLMKLAASKVLEAFPGSFSSKANAIFTGNPLRQNFSADIEREIWTQTSGRNLRILVLGGSQGAKVLNDTVPQTLALFKNMDIQHQTGTVMHPEVEQRYQELNRQAAVLPFIEDIDKAYRWADLIICRAGAMTVSEISACGLPAILIPLLHAIDDHQTANAKYLADAGAAMILPQPDLTPSNLHQALLKTITNLPNMSRAAKAMAKLDATRCVADICIEEAVA